MSTVEGIIAEVADLYKIIPLKPLRRTAAVSFDVIPGKLFSRIDAMDRVIHQGGAISPGPVAGVERPWYMHPHQDDNLVVLHGTRHVDIYSRKAGRMESFEVSPNLIKQGDRVLYDGAAMLVWPCHVFHRIRSTETGSASLNFAVHYQGFDIRTNFNIYDLDTNTGEFRVIREGHLDQSQI